jgi:hypothetical protein
MLRFRSKADMFRSISFSLFKKFGQVDGSAPSGKIVELRAFPQQVRMGKNERFLLNAQSDGDERRKPGLG